MYQDTLNHFGDLARKKSDFLKQSPLGFTMGALMAGAYVGMGIILIFSVGAGFDPGTQKLVMGVSFGVALTLIVFAGAELFTGHTMYSTIGFMQRKTSLRSLLGVWSTSWLFNFLGSVGLAALFVAGGGGVLLKGGHDLLIEIADYKMNASAGALVARAILCNWLVCLALWMAARVQSDAAKAIVIFWCLFAFIASGFEHSVANMTLLSIALLSPHPETLSFGGMMHNLLWVTFGNIIGGAVFMAIGYATANGGVRAQQTQGHQL